MFIKIKLYFTDRPSYERIKRYEKRQKAVRKKLKKQVKNFCPWSGYYMHEMIKTMLEFYHKTYLAGDCCWREDSSREEIATSLGVAMHWAEELDRLDDLYEEEMIYVAKKDAAFDKYVADWEAKLEIKISDSSHPDALLAGLAEEYLTEKYTKALYNIIGEHIWEWCD